jgi:peptide/nickel transport system permease protein
MLAVVARRLVELILTLLVTSLVVFASLYLVPGSPIAYLTSGRAADAATIARINAEYDLNQPFLPRYWHWLTGLFHGDLGRSLVSNETTWQLLQPRLETTLLLVALATVETVLIGIGLGVFAALSNKGVDTAVTVGSSTGVGIPGFVAAAVLLSVFSVKLGWFPVFGNGNGFFGHLDHVFLPSIALAIASTAYMARLTRSAVREERTKEYVDMANARGLSPGQTVRRHILRNATPSILTAAGVTFVGLMASEVVVESAFGLNGMGSLLVQSVGAKDFAVVQVLVLVYVAVFMIVNTGVDLVAMRVDPRLAIDTAAARL